MRTVYLAALYSRKSEMREVAQRIADEAEYESTSTWLWSDLDLSHAGQEWASRQDVADIKHSDVLVLFTQPVGSMNSGGGRHTELGLAIAWEKKIVVCGPRETVFCYFPGIEVVEDVDALIRYLKTGDGRVSATRDKEGR